MSKDTKYKISVMQAYEEGKKIECKNRDCRWTEWILPQEPAWNWAECDYRIKEESKYRPYKDTEEMINDFCERSGAKRSTMGEPFIWMKNGLSRFLILDFEGDTVWTRSARWTMQELFDDFTYCNGSPIGKKE